MVIQIIVVKKFYSIIPLLKAYTYIFCERERLAILFGCYSNHAQFEKGKKGFNIATGRKWFLSCLSTYRHTHTRAHTRTHTHTLHTLARKRVCTLNGSIYSGLRTSTCCCCSCGETKLCGIYIKNISNHTAIPNPCTGDHKCSLIICRAFPQKIKFIVMFLL